MLTTFWDVSQHVWDVSGRRKRFCGRFEHGLNSTSGGGGHGVGWQAVAAPVIRRRIFHRLLQFSKSRQVWMPDGGIVTGFASKINTIVYFFIVFSGGGDCGGRWGDFEFGGLESGSQGK